MMTRIQTRLKAMLTAALLTTALTASAQEVSENYLSYPQGFIGLQGGGQLTFSNYNNWKYITPTASISAGVHFTPVIGARLHFNGVWDKGSLGYDTDASYKYKYLNSNLDLMVNMVNLIAKGDYHPVNVYLIGGVGLAYTWGNGTAYEHKLPLAYEHGRLGHNFRVGTMLDVKVARNWSVNLEVAANSHNDRFNSKYSGSDDWQLTAQLGVAYKFGLRQKVKGDRKDVDFTSEAPNTSDVETNALPANTNVGISKPEPKPAPTVETPTNISRNIFFTLRSSVITPTEQAKLAEVAKWLKENPSAKVTVTGYADKGTGNPVINARYAKQRAETVTKELTKKYGIEASRITTESKGDTVQPFPNDNDQNRVTIVIAEK